MIFVTKKELQAMEEIINYLMYDERKDWEAEDKPQKHIYHALKTLERIVTVVRAGKKKI